MNSVLTQFSKGVKTSRALSFNLAGSRFCDSRCKLKGAGCYAYQPQKQYKGYRAKLKRHGQMNPANLVNLARYEANNIKNLSWFRFSVSGSVPAKSAINRKWWREFIRVFRDLCSELNAHNVPIHLPVESIEKARTYRSILRGLPIVVRRTIQDKRNLANFNDCAAYVVGDRAGKHNVGEAFRLAEEIRQTGKTVVVCPAIEGVSQSGIKSKCGGCKSCSHKLVDLVIFSRH